MAYTERYNEREIVQEISNTINDIMSDPNFSRFDNSQATQRLNSIKDLRHTHQDIMMQHTQRMAAIKP